MTRRQLPIFEDSIINNISSTYYSQYYNCVSNSSSSSNSNHNHHSNHINHSNHNNVTAINGSVNQNKHCKRQRLDWANSSNNTSCEISHNASNETKTNANGSTHMSSSRARAIRTFASDNYYSSINTHIYDFSFATKTNNNNNISNTANGHRKRKNETKLFNNDQHVNISPYRSKRSKAKFKLKPKTSNLNSNSNSNSISTSSTKATIPTTASTTSSIGTRTMKNDQFHKFTKMEHASRYHNRSSNHSDNYSDYDGIDINENANCTSITSNDCSNNNKKSVNKEKLDENYSSKSACSLFGSSMNQTKFGKFDKNTREQTNTFGLKLKPPKYSDLSLLTLKSLSMYNHTPGKIIGKQDYGFDDENGRNGSMPQFFRALNDSKHGIDCQCNKCTKHLRASHSQSQSQSQSQKSKGRNKRRKKNKENRNDSFNNINSSCNENSSDDSSSDKNINQSVKLMDKSYLRQQSRSNPVSIVTKLKQYYKWENDFGKGETSSSSTNNNTNPHWSVKWTWTCSNRNNNNGNNNNNNNNNSINPSWIGRSIIGKDKNKKDAKKQCAINVLRFLQENDNQENNFARNIDLLKKGFKLGSIDKPNNSNGSKSANNSNFDLLDESVPHRLVSLNFHYNYFEIKPFYGCYSQNGNFYSNNSNSNNNMFTMHKNRAIWYEMNNLTCNGNGNLEICNNNVNYDITKYFCRLFFISNETEPHVKDVLYLTNQSMNHERQVPYPCHAFVDDRGAILPEFQLSLAFLFCFD